MSRSLHLQSTQLLLDSHLNCFVLLRPRQISELHKMTVETEETQRTIDQSLDYIDSQQQELSGILDLYEDQVQKMFEKDAATAGVNPNGLRPVDEQREQTYSLAESLNRQLDDMSLNLSSMIEEINQTAPLVDGSSSDPVSRTKQQNLTTRVVSFCFLRVV